MIHKLKKKFIILATASLFLLMTVLVLIMNIVNYHSVLAESDTILDMLSGKDAPSAAEQPRLEKAENTAKPEAENFSVPHGMSPEVPYEARYFAVLISENGAVEESDLSRIISVNETSAKAYIQEAIASESKRGSIGQFRYLKSERGGKTKITFLDCGRKLNAFFTFLWSSIAVGFCGCLCVFVVFLFAAKKIVNPIAESYEKQKRFVSDAGHEIKTPLTIISANVDLLEEDCEKEELSDIRQQVKRLAQLTDSLIFLSKMEEADHITKKAEMPLSDIVQETVSGFHALTVSKKLQLSLNIQPNISLRGSPQAIVQLISLLLDNAIKYSPENSKIAVTLSARKKSAVLSVDNPTREKVDAASLSSVFDRFYRSDSSRSSATSGYGIGLSVAKAIVDTHDGSISASSKGDFDFCITAVLPL